MKTFMRTILLSLVIHNCVQPFTTLGRQNLEPRVQPRENNRAEEHNNLVTMCGQLAAATLIPACWALLCMYAHSLRQQ